MTQSPSASAPLKSLIKGVYLPAILFETGIGAVIPIIPLSAMAMGASQATAAVMAALLGVGLILGDLPAGALATRIGDRRALIVASLVTILAAGILVFADNLWLLAAGVLLMGATSSVAILARQSYLTEATHPMRRARALSTLGGVYRIGLFLGPFLAAPLLYFGDFNLVFVLTAVTSGLTALVVWLVPDIDVEGLGARADGVKVSFLEVLKANKQVLMTLGLGVIAVGAIRGARQTVLPLWSEHIGLSPGATAVIFGISSGVDMLLFYPSGKLMDRRGRMWVAIPFSLLMALGFGLLPLSSEIILLSVAAMVLGLGNGMGSGIIMTLGADIAPPQTRAKFLSFWRLLNDTGGAAGPLVVSGLAAVGSLAVGIWSMSLVSLGATGAFVRWMPRFSVHANRTTRRRANLIP